MFPRKPCTSEDSELTLSTSCTELQGGGVEHWEGRKHVPIVICVVATHKSDSGLSGSAGPSVDGPRRGHCVALRSMPFRVSSWQ